MMRDADEAGRRVSDELLAPPAPLDAAERETLHALLLRMAEDGLT